MSEMPLQLALHDSVQEVLEKMFFVEALDEPAAETDSPEGSMAVNLMFEGSPSGALKLSVSAGVNSLKNCMIDGRNIGLPFSRAMPIVAS